MGYGLCLQWIFQYYGISTCNIMDFPLATFGTFILQQTQLVDGNIVESTYDMWVRYRDGKEVFYGVKYFKGFDTINPKKHNSMMLQINAQRLWSEEHGYTYIVRTDQHIRQNKIFLANMKALIPYLKQHMIPIETDRHLVFKRVSSEPCSITELSKYTGLSLSRIFETLSRLFVNGEVKCNFEHILLGVDTEVWINGE
ncbi:MAG: hypothetical protein APF81_02820 [Desulfosporosinus sp. BRH_c37]|nr:MAG: hypothetical protein APF81_02820 [Desulfosporosinus sp. BRH_c37]